MSIMNGNRTLYRIATFIRRASSIVAALLLVTMACSRPVLKEKTLDSLRDHYASGMQKLEANDLKSAGDEFNKAVALEPHAPHGYVGLAYLESKRMNYSIALDYIKKALKSDDSFADAYAVRGAILTARKKGDKWYGESVKSFDRAFKIEPENEKALFFSAECDLKAQRYGEAHPKYTKVAELKGLFAPRAKERAGLVERILSLGEIPESCSYIVLDDKIDRTDMCVLLLDKFRLLEQLDTFRSMRSDNGRFPVSIDNVTVPPDVNSNRLKRYILTVLALNIDSLGVFPNGYFYTDRIISRAQFASAVEDVLVLFYGKAGVATKFIGTESPFTDVRSDFYAYNAIALAVDMKVMDADGNRNFRPEAPVTGLEAIDYLVRLEIAVKQCSSQ